jgi:hypothetical protein
MAWLIRDGARRSRWLTRSLRTIRESAEFPRERGNRRLAH